MLPALGEVRHLEVVRADAAARSFLLVELRQRPFRQTISDLDRHELLLACDGRAAGGRRPTRGQGTIASEAGPAARRESRGGRTSSNSMGASRLPTEARVASGGEPRWPSSRRRSGRCARRPRRRAGPGAPGPGRPPRPPRAATIAGRWGASCCLVALGGCFMSNLIAAATARSIAAEGLAGDGSRARSRRAAPGRGHRPRGQGRGRRRRTSSTSSSRSPSAAASCTTPWPAGEAHRPPRLIRGEGAGLGGAEAERRPM